MVIEGEAGVGQEPDHQAVAVADPLDAINQALEQVLMTATGRERRWQLNQPAWWSAVVTAVPAIARL